MTEYSRQRDFLFCEMCGAMLLLSQDSPKYARCPLCKFKKRVKDIAGKEIRYTVSTEDMKRALGVSALEDIEEEKELKQMDYNAKCKACSIWAWLMLPDRLDLLMKGRLSFIHVQFVHIDRLKTQKNGSRYVSKWRFIPLLTHESIRSVPELYNDELLLTIEELEYILPA